MLDVKHKTLKLVEQKLGLIKTLHFEVDEVNNEYCSIKIYSLTDGKKTVQYHWIMDLNEEELWVADTKLPFLINIALIERGAGVKLM